MVMGMGHRMPVAAISGAGDIQQFCRTANGIGPVSVKAIVISAHNFLSRASDFIYIDIILYFLAFFNSKYTINIERAPPTAIIGFAQRYTNCTNSDAQTQQIAEISQIARYIKFFAISRLRKCRYFVYLRQVEI